MPGPILTQTGMDTYHEVSSKSVVFMKDREAPRPDSKLLWERRDNDRHA